MTKESGIEKKTNEPLICESCGTEKNVKETLNPYALEISGREVEVRLCDHCYREYVMDI